MKLEFSAGGIVLKKSENTLSILLAQHSKNHAWGFPKGIIGDKEIGESKEATAIREVKEETGIEAEILSPATEETFWYNFAGEKRKKTVTYYFMKYLTGDFIKRDLEMEAVEWVPLDQVLNKLTHKNSRKMFEKLLPQIEKLSLAM